MVEGKRLYDQFKKRYFIICKIIIQPNKAIRIHSLTPVLFQYKRVHIDVYTSFKLKFTKISLNSQVSIYIHEHITNVLNQVDLNWEKLARGDTFNLKRKWQCKKKKKKNPSMSTHQAFAFTRPRRSSSPSISLTSFKLSSPKSTALSPSSTFTTSTHGTSPVITYLFLLYLFLFVNSLFH